MANMAWDEGSGTICLYNVPGRQAGWMPELRRAYESDGSEFFEVHDKCAGSSAYVDGSTWVVAKHKNRGMLKKWALEFYAMHPHAAERGTYALPGTTVSTRYVEPIAPLNASQAKLLLLT